MAELDDPAGLFVSGDAAEAFADMQYAVLRDPARLAFARRVMSEAMRRWIASRPASGNSTAPAEQRASDRTQTHSRRS